MIAPAIPNTIIPPPHWQWICNVFIPNGLRVPLGQKGNWIRDVEEMGHI